MIPVSKEVEKGAEKLCFKWKVRFISCWNVLMKFVLNSKILRLIKIDGMWMVIRLTLTHTH